MNIKREPIAIVGIGGIFPQSPTLDDFWDNISKGVNTASEVPDGRWPIPVDTAYHPEKGKLDRAYSKRGCFIDGFKPDFKGLNIDPKFAAGLDPAFHLLLRAGSDAFNDGLTNNLDLSRVGVIIGNLVLPSEKSSEIAFEYLGRQIEKKVLGDKFIDSPKTIDPINRFSAGLPAGILAKALNLGGGSYTLDAACASSLYALSLAADELLSGRADAMLAGGLSRPDCFYTQMGFSQLRALSPDGVSAPFDEKSNGLVVGEGSGMLLLKRLSDAERDGDHIYGCIRGVGLSNEIG
ncbi:MAG: polyketide synthase [Nitrospinota bacterium]